MRQTMWCFIIAALIVAAFIGVAVLLWPRFGIGSLFIEILVLMVTCFIAAGLEEAGFAKDNTNG